MSSADRLLACALLVGAFAWILPAFAQKELPARVSVCDVAANPERYQGRPVEIDGRLVSDFHHASGVGDEACPQAYIMIGSAAPRAQGVDEFHDAWMVTRSCPQDGLRFTVRGRIERQHYWDLERWVISASAFSSLRRTEGSACPMTMRELYERLERRSAGE